jgi:hypothetical protein
MSRQINEHTVEYDSAEEYERDMGHRPRKKLVITTRKTEHPQHGVIETPLFVRYTGRI